MTFDLENSASEVAYKLLTGLCAPRPIALITSMSRSGSLNAAPFSAYNYLCTDPPIVAVGVTSSRVALFRQSDGQRLELNAYRSAINIKQAREETQPC